VRRPYPKEARVKPILFVVVVASLVLAPTTAAWARGDGWELVQQPAHLTVHCGSAPVDVTFPVSQEYQRTVTLDDGTVVTQITGRLTVRLAARSGASLTLNISGPAKYIEYPNGDLEVRSMGLYGGPPLISGLPDLIAAAGRADVIFHPDGSYTVVHLQNHLVDVCAELGL
jgi:hypothetical protein